MLGLYYRPQLTSMLSIVHRISGVLLTVLGVPLLFLWLVAVGEGADAYAWMQSVMGGWLRLIVIPPMLFCLCYHLINGIRHLVWDTGHWLDLKSVYLSGWLVLAASIILTGILAAVVL